MIYQMNYLADEMKVKNGKKTRVFLPLEIHLRVFYTHMKLKVIFVAPYPKCYDSDRAAEIFIVQFL